MEVRRISAKDTLPIRSKMLRNGLPTSECVFDHDHSSQTFHLGAFEAGRLVSVASFFYHKHEDIEDEHQYQLRGMATLDGYQAKGLSSELLTVGFPIVKQNQCNVVWCNAREGAIGFYEKLGFNASNELFEIPGVGQHILMIKRL